MRFEDSTSAGAARRAAIARDSAARINPDGIETGRRVYAASPRIEPYEIEWVRSDLADGEISKFVGGIAGDESTVTTATRNHPKRCYRTSTSSGYSSHSPPLSAGSYSCYASARDPSYGRPRSIWPSIIYRHAEERNADYEGIYTCHVCGCVYDYSPPPPVSPLPRPSAREVLLELSRTLNSVIDSDVTMTPEDILRDISRIISLRLPSRSDNVYEYVCAPTTLNSKNLSSGYSGNVSSGVNPADSKVHVGPRCLYGHSSARSVPLLQNKITGCEDGEAGKSLGIAKKQSCETPGPYVRKYLHGKHIENSCSKKSFRLDGDSKQCRNGLTSTELQYSMQLECSDVGSSSESTIASLTANDWNHRGLTVKGLGDDFDFTLDVARAERLGRAIARAKRKRQWCRILTILFGLAFFVLSVIIVSLFVTRGRKVFGSM
ncbi:uncharacterized protein [Linepithema humile]|uniref:uncharacterized protein n=1 Tax=Linepithema humile TaxID=83485 RepID=UPI00351E0FA6